jgi:hypothetical protein
MLRCRGALYAVLVGVLLCATSAQARGVKRWRRSVREYAPPVLRLEVDRGILGSGRTSGFHGALEGRHAGLGFYMHSLRRQAGGQEERYGLWGVHLMMVASRSEQGRLRLDVGVTRTRMPGATFVGPSLGLSAETLLGGPLSMEGRVHFTLAPHRQVDAEGGLALSWGVLSVRGGWRALLLNDLGLITGRQRLLAMGGPYLGAGFGF